MSFKQNLSNVRNLLIGNNSVRFFQIASDVISATAPFIERPTIMNGANAIFNIGKSISTNSDIFPEEYYEDNGYIKIFGVDFAPIIIPHLQKHVINTIKTASEFTYIQISKIEDVEFAYSIRQKLHNSTNIYVKFDSDIHKAKKMISDLIWSDFKSNSVVVKRRKNSTDEIYVSQVSFDIDENIVALPSKKATEIANTIKLYLKAGYNRSIMLYGPPGTGKSTIARKVISDLNMRSLRLRVEDIPDFSNSTLKETINIFKPDAIILDDFDRVDMQNSLFEMLEQFERSVKVIFATVNDKSKLDPALLRPGRFDELIAINRLDDEVVKKVLGSYDDAFEVVKNWPIIYIEEYVKRRKVLSKELAEKALKDLQQRVHTFYHDDEESNDKDDHHDDEKKEYDDSEFPAYE